MTPHPSTDQPSDEFTLAGLPLDLFWEKYKSALIAGVVLLIVIFAAVIGWMVLSHLRTADSEALFANAKTAEDFRAVADKYPGTPVAGNALMLLAASERKEVAKSDAIYQQIISQNPNYLLVPSASLGLAANAETANDLNKAVTLYQQTAEAYQNSYAAAYALYTSGELLLREGKREEAIRDFRNAGGTYPDSPAGQISEMQAQRLSQSAE